MAVERTKWNEESEDEAITLTSTGTAQTAVTLYWGEEPAGEDSGGIKFSLISRTGEQR